MNQKTGRNEPCPCGSGNKYKKCCMAADEARESKARSEASASRQQAASVAERLGLAYAPPSKPTKQGARALLAALSADQIVARLAGYGLEVDLETFPELGRAHPRAWSIAEQLWWPTLSPEVDDDEREFVALAACELWRRTSAGAQDHAWRRWLAKGYEHSRANEDSAACDAWSPLWPWLHAQLTPSMRDAQAADMLFEGEEFMLNWLQDYALALRGAAAGQPVYARQGVLFCEQVLAQFSAEDDDVLESLRGDLAALTALAEPEQVPGSGSAGG